MPIRKIKAGLVLTKDVDEFVGEPGYLFYDESPNGDKTLRISDGVTPGGVTFLNALGSASGDSTVTNLLYSQDSTAVQIQDNFVPTEDDTYSLGTPDKRFSELHVAQGSIFLGGLVLKDRGDGAMQVFQSDGVTPADIIYAKEHTISIVGDDSTGTAFNLDNSIKFTGTGGITVSVSGDDVTIDGSGVAGGGGSSTLTVSDDASTTVNITTGQDTLTIAGGNSLTSSITGDVVTLSLNKNITVNQISSDDSTAVQVADNFVPTQDDVYSLGTRDKRWSEIHVSQGSIFLGDLVIRDSGDGRMQIFQADGVTPARLDAPLHQLTLVGDDSTGSTFDLNNTVKFRGINGVSVSVSGDDVTIDGSAVVGSGSFTISDDSSTTATITNGQDTLKFAGGTNITTAISGDTLTITAPSTVSSFTNDAGYIDTAQLTIVGDDSTGTSFDASQSPTVRFLGAGNVSVAVSGSNVIITGSGAGGSATYTQDTAPSSPTDGETWFDTDSGALYIWVEESGNGQWIETGSAGSTLDAESVTSFRFGDDDTDTTTVSQGETLSILGGQGIATDITGDGEITISSTGATVVTDDTAPTSPVDGDLWYDTDSGSFYVNVVESGSANWIEVGSSGSGGNQIYTQDDSPSTPTDGDLWWDTDAGALYIYVVESGVGNWIETAGSGQAGGGGITSLAADSTPELGGNLDANAYNINNVGTISVATNGDPGTDPATDSGVGYIYAKGATAELFVKDGAGNITQISPHNDEGEWVYYSENVKTGKRVKVNMEKMIRRLEEITGETFFEIDDPHKINY